MGVVFDTLRELSLGQARRHGNVALVPIVAPAARPEQRPVYRTLDAALRSGHCRLEADGAGVGQAPPRLANDGDEPVLVLDGEILSGAGAGQAANLSVLIGPYGELTLPVCRTARTRLSAPPAQAAPRLLPGRTRAARLADVSRSLLEQGLREANQAEVWVRLEAGPTERWPGGAEQSRAAQAQALVACAAACQPRTRQVGAIYCLDGRVAALELFDSEASYRHYARPTLASHVIEALRGTTRIESAPDQRALAEFLSGICGADERCYEALGEGEDLRLEAEDLAGAGLVRAGRLLHLLIYQRPPERRYDDPRIVPFRWRPRVAAPAISSAR